jgi:hypothetical protein
MASSVDLMDRIIATAKMRLPGLTSAALNLELFNTLQEFFNDSNAWRYDIQVPLTAGTMEYPIFPPAGSALVQIMDAEYNGRPLPQTPVSDTGSSVNLVGLITGQVNPASSDTLFTPDVTGSPGNVFTYAVFFPKYITLDIPPSDDAATLPITLSMSLRMNPESVALDPNEWPLEEWMVDAFHEPWMDGVQGRLMSQINKPYSNIPVSAYHMKRFRKFIARAKQTAEKGYVYNATNWRYPRGGFI